MKNYDFDWQTNEFLLYCRTAQFKEGECTVIFVTAAQQKKQQKISLLHSLEFTGQV